MATVNSISCMDPAVKAELDIIAKMPLTPWVFKFWQSVAVARTFASALEHDTMSKEALDQWELDRFQKICEDLLVEVKMWNQHNITCHMLTKSLLESDVLLTGDNIHRRACTIRKNMQNCMIPTYLK